MTADGTELAAATTLRTTPLAVVRQWAVGNLPLLVRVISFGAFLVAWEIYGQRQPNQITAAPLSDVLKALFNLLQKSEFRAAFAETLRPFAIGLALALGVGVPLGLLIGQSRAIRGVITPYLSFLNALPISTVVPLVVIGLGIGMESRVAVIFLFSIVEIVLNSAAGVAYVNAGLVEMARSFGASRRKIFWRIVLPGSLPGIMAGVRFGTGRAVVGMVVAELLLVSVGIGRLISLYKGRFQTANLYATVLAISIIGVLLLILVRRFEARVLHWRT